MCEYQFSCRVALVTPVASRLNAHTLISVPKYNQLLPVYDTDRIYRNVPGCLLHSSIAKIPLNNSEGGLILTSSNSREH